MRLTLALAAALALTGCAEPSVTRIVDGQPVEGRFISGAAYAYYARGAAAEAAGDLEGARRAFERALAEDPESPEIWTRLGALLCRTRVDGGTGSDGGIAPRAVEAFDRARAIDPDHGPLYRAHAHCLASHGDMPAALADADRALALDPDDLDTALLRVWILDGLGRTEEAVRAARAVAARRPASAEPWRTLRDLATHHGNAALAREATERFSALTRAPDGRLQVAAPLAAVDQALAAGDLAEAQRRALQQRMPGAEVALRAAALGLTALAREQAELVLGADPADASARIALVAVADLRGDVRSLAALMQSMPRRSTPPSPLARWLLAEVLRRRVSTEAARAWLGEVGAGGEWDPLLAATEKRVRAALVGP